MNYGSLAVIGAPVRRGKNNALPVRCACGVEKVVRVDLLRRGLVSSCGCQRAARFAATMAARPKPSTKVCRGCGEEKPRTEAHWYFRRRNPVERCKPCYNARRAGAPRRRDPEQQRAYLQRPEVKERYRAYHRARARLRYRQIPAVKMRACVTSHVRRALKGQMGARSGRTMESLLGYSPEMLVAHLEALFEPWMSWENYGAWEVDHRRPVSSFNLPAEVRECWALDNLRPLGRRENRQKGAAWLAQKGMQGQ